MVADGGGGAVGARVCDVGLFGDDDDVVGKLQTGLIKVSSTVLGGMHLGIA